MLPNADHPPPAAAERVSDLRITVLIAIEFPLPPSTPSLGTWRVFRERTAMPKAAVHKHGQAIFRKNKIWSAEERKAAAPAGDPEPPEQLRQRDFRILVAMPPNSGHDQGTL